MKPWQHLTKYKLLLYAMRKPLDKMEPSPDVDEQRNDITVMVIIAAEFLLITRRDFSGGVEHSVGRYVSLCVRTTTVVRTE